jgi:2-oxoisovalerate dehydrogenase E2 component (dihydrolipoyl transacylase)
VIKEFRLPDAGEGLTEAEIVTWRVQPGDAVKVNDVIVEIETAKSLVELPCPWAGVVAGLLVAVGETVPVGTPIIAVEVPDDAVAAPAVAEPLAPATVHHAVQPPSARTPVLVGYGVKDETLTRRARRVAGAPLAAPSVEAPAPVAPTAGSAVAVAHALAAPPVRKLARDLGIDLLRIPGSGAGGIVTRRDVETVARGGWSPAAVTSTSGTSSSDSSSPGSFTRPAAGGPEVTRIPVKGVRKATAEAMVASAFTAPHVTEWVTCDVTRTVKLIDRLRADRRFEGVKVSPLLIACAALLTAVRRHPEVNASFDAAAGEIVMVRPVHLGIAAATPRGLVVPVIRDADRLGLRELAEAIGELTATARGGRTQPAQMSGGTITVTNVGVFGIDGGTPIINPGQAAILALGQVALRPWVHKGKVKPRWTMQVSLSFDHRLVDGELGSHVLAAVAAVLTDPATALA